MSGPIIVDAYDPAWPQLFEAIRARFAPVLEGTSIAIEHVGSTSVPGLAAKPIVDIDVVVADDDAAVATAITALATLGYIHSGDLGVPGREAFRAPPGSAAHHLYVCRDGCASLRNHLAVRDRLRADPEAVAAYGALKRDLAARYPDDIDAYVSGKSRFILGILAAAGFSHEELVAIGRVNGVTWP